MLFHSLQVAFGVVSCPSPYFDDIGSKVPKLSTLEELDVVQVLLSLVTRIWLLFLPFLTLRSSYFLVSFIHLTNEDNILLINTCNIL